MPIHDWSKVPAGLFHEFHQSWSVRIKDALNSGLLPADHFAMVEQRVIGLEPDVIAVETKRNGLSPSLRPAGGVAMAERPRTRVVRTMESEAAGYARMANRIVVRHQLGDVVAVIEILSPGNKSNKASFQDFLDKVNAFLHSGVHLLLIDLFPPSPRDPSGLYNAITEVLFDSPVELPVDQPLSLIGYDATWPITAYLETVAVGDSLPDMPLFVARESHILVPLESTYQATWGYTPVPIRDMVATRGRGEET